jgi:hypothetical protein
MAEHHFVGREIRECRVRAGDKVEKGSRRGKTSSDDGIGGVVNMRDVGREE